MTARLSRTTWMILAAAGATAAIALAAAPSQHDGANDAVQLAKPAHDKTQLRAMPQLATAGQLDARMAGLARRTEASGDVVNLFEAVSNKPAPPPPPPPPKPVAPPFPYTIIGSMQDGKQATVYLEGPARVLTAKEDQIIDGVYHVDEANPSHLTVTYMPLHQKQVINFGKAE